MSRSRGAPLCDASTRQESARLDVTRHGRDGPSEHARTHRWPRVSAMDGCVDAWMDGLARTGQKWQPATHGRLPQHASPDRRNWAVRAPWLHRRRRNSTMHRRPRDATAATKAPKAEASPRIHLKGSSQDGGYGWRGDGQGGANPRDERLARRNDVPWRERGPRVS